MNVRGMRIMDSRGVFNGGFGAQVVPVADDAAAAQAVLMMRQPRRQCWRD